jgi:hypothetical protein
MRVARRLSVIRRRSHFSILWGTKMSIKWWEWHEEIQALYPQGPERNSVMNIAVRKHNKVIVTKNDGSKDVVTFNEGHWVKNGNI